VGLRRPDRILVGSPGLRETRPVRSPEEMRMSTVARLGVPAGVHALVTSGDGLLSPSGEREAAGWSGAPDRATVGVSGGTSSVRIEPA